MRALDKELVRESLTIEELLKASGFVVNPGRNGENRSDWCPWCGEGTSGKFCVRNCVGYCHACGHGGDLFEVAGAVLGLDVCTHFAKVLAVCADLAGLDAGDEHDAQELARKREQRQRMQADEAARRAETRRIAERGAADIWRGLSGNSRRGQEYLAGRGILPQHAGRECRYTSRSVCLPLWRDGEIINIVGRRFDGGTTPKIRGLAGCGTLGTFGRPSRNSMHAGPIVVVEGLMDYLSARQLSPTRLVLGAHGCANLSHVATVAAQIIAETPTGLVLVGHRDKAGEQSIERAREAAINAGVSPVAIQCFELTEGCNDLNDHLLHGGRRAA